MLMQRLNTGVTGKIFKAILLGVLFAAVAGLVLTDAGGFFRGGVGRQDVARVGDKHISIVSFGNQYRRALQQANMQEDQARQMGVAYMVLQQEINREIMLQAARKNGIRVDNAYVGTELRKQLEELKLPGTPKEKLDILLQQQGIDERTFVDLIRGDFAANILVNAATDKTVTAPDTMALALFKASREKRIVNLVTLSTASLKNNKALDDKALQDFYNENKDRYKTAEKRDIAVLILPDNLFTSDVAVTPEQSRAFYDENASQFMKPERVRLEQIIITDEKEAKEIASKKSADLSAAKGDKAQYIQSDWYSRSNLPQELQDAIFTTKAKGLIGPVKSSLGWHVMKVEAFEDAKPESFESVKETIERQLKDEKLDQQMAAVTEKLDGFALAGQGIDDIAQEYKLTPVKISDVSSENLESKVSSLNLSDSLALRVKENALAQEENEPNFIETTDGKYAMLEVTSITPSVVPALDKVKTIVRADAQKDADRKSILALAEAIIAKTKDQASFDKALADKGLRSETTSALGQDDLEKSKGKEIASLAFVLSENNKLSFANTGENLTLVHLQSVIPTTEQPSDKELVALKQEAGKNLALDLQQQLMQAWNKEIGSTINYALMKQQFTDQPVQQQ